MATIKLYHDTRYSSKKCGSVSPVKIAVNHRSKTSYILTEVRVRASEWDMVHSRVVGHPAKNALNRALQRQLGEVSRALERVSERVYACDVDAKELCRLLKVEMSLPVHPGRRKPGQLSDLLGDFFARYQDYKELSARTSELYAVTWRRIEAWLGQKRA